jgi:hypothetical protein
MLIITVQVGKKATDVKNRLCRILHSEKLSEFYKSPSSLLFVWRNKEERSCVVGVGETGNANRVLVAKSN